MDRLQILTGPDRLAFAHSLFNTQIDSVPAPGWWLPPHSRGRAQPRSYLGESFLTKNSAGDKRQFLLIIMESKRKNEDGLVQEFKAVLWGACDEFRDLLFHNPLECWVEFRGEFDFKTQEGWLEQIKS